MAKKYSLRKIISALLLGTIVFACDGIFIPDPIDPFLPKYTETGNDVAGAIINDEVWKSHVLFSWGGSNDAPYLHYYSYQDSLVISFTGQKRGAESDNTYIVFSLRGTGVNKFEDLPHLNNKKFALGGSNFGGYVIDPWNYDCTTSGTGQLYLRSVKYAPERNYISISGTFGFDVTDPVCGDYTVTYGRFDYRVSYINYN